MSAPGAVLGRVLAAFGLPGGVVSATPLGDGHIHRTWAVELAGPARQRVVAQSLNARVFPDLGACERNLRRIDDHIGRTGATGVRVPRLHRTGAGFVHWTDGDGSTWRVSDYAEGTRAGTTAADADEAAEAARAFGGYVATLASLPGGPLEDTIPRFHDLPRRRRQLADAARDDRVGRRARCIPELARAEEMAASVAADLAALPPAPIRTVHNDAKVANVLFDAASGKAAYVVDLDTTMDGTVLADVGELLRTASTVWPEDAEDVAGLQVEDDRIEAVVRGFLGGAGAVVTREERGAFALAGPLLATENAVRFLADFLDGDRYFSVDGPDHNLRRARAQLRVAELLRARHGLVARAALG